MDRTGRAVCVELAIRRDTVEGWAADRCHAVFDRDRLQGWLATPAGRLAVDDMTWDCTGEGVAVTVERLVPEWNLSPRELERLRQWV